MLPHEDGWSYSLFVAYLELPPCDRSHARVAQIARRTKKNIEIFSAKHNWVARARAYDQHILQQRLENPYA